MPDSLNDPSASAGGDAGSVVEAAGPGGAGGAGGGGARDRKAAIRLESLVFLGPCSQRHQTVLAAKKMLHPPSLVLFCLIELPGADYQREILRASLQDWIARWCALQEDHPSLFVQVRESYWDTPPGYPMGILCEYMPLGDLDELLQSSGGLPEHALREVTQAVVEALDALHFSTPPLIHGYLKPSQVQFGADGCPRLAFGLEHRLRGCQLFALPSPHGSRGEARLGSAHEGSSRFGAGGSRGSGRGSADPGPVVDIFELGLLLLVAALGGLDVLLDAIPYAREFGASRVGRARGQPPGAVSVDTCALLQHELRGAFCGDLDESGADNMGAYLPPASDLLFNRRYSPAFLSFVSTCLEAHTREGGAVTTRDLLRHEFLRDPGACSASPLVTLREVQAMARLLNEAPEPDPVSFGPAKSARALVPGMAPSVAQSAQLYLGNIAQAIAPHRGPAGPLPAGLTGGALGEELSGAAAGPAEAGWQQNWEGLVADTARTLGMPRVAVRDSLRAQLDRLAAKEARHRVVAADL